MNAKKSLSNPSSNTSDDLMQNDATTQAAPTLRKTRRSTHASAPTSDSASISVAKDPLEHASNASMGANVNTAIAPLIETQVKSMTAGAIDTPIAPLLYQAHRQDFDPSVTNSPVTKMDAGSSHDAESDSVFTDELIASFMQGTHIDPFAVLGAHRVGDTLHVRTFQPGASAVKVINRDGMVLAQLQPIALAGAPDVVTGFFSGAVPELHSTRYVLHVEWPSAGVNHDGQITVQETEDPYSFSPLVTDFDLHLLREGKQRELANCLGAIETEIDGVAGVRFAVWAPNAQRVAVVGEFNQWDERRHGMRLRHDAGVWELFVPRLSAGTRYQFHITAADGTRLPLKADPVARQTSAGASHLSVVASSKPFVWDDEAWLDTRAQLQSMSAAISIYELHVGSWLRILEENARSLTWQELSERLIPYVQSIGFTHIQLMPIMEHPFGGSWGYQPLSQFAPTSRFGDPAAFAAFVNDCHRAGVGVILDWVPAHFPNDAHGLAYFDGSALYEHADPREGMHQDWNTLIYNFGRNEVRGFLIASALEWLERFHIDGLRVDAVASMLYRDYSRKAGEWVPNIYGGRENLEAVDFIKELNHTVAERCPGVMMIAEESTSWPGVTAPVSDGEGSGLGFDFKWNMGWMHDTLEYVEQDPIYRRYQHQQMTFGMVYAYSERFILPISHDEVVHGKRSLLAKFPGDAWQKRAQLRAYFGFMFTHPGKKLLFMGTEFGQWGEWNHDQSPEWHLLDDVAHRGIQQTVHDLNHLYRDHASLHATDADPAGFRWLVMDDAENSVFVYLRQSDADERERPLLVICNMTPVTRYDYRVGVPVIDSHRTASAGSWSEIFNSDADIYGGSNLGNFGRVPAQDQPSHGHGHSLVLTVPAFTTLIFKKD